VSISCYFGKLQDFKDTMPVDSYLKRDYCIWSCD